MHARRYFRFENNFEYCVDGKLHFTRKIIGRYVNGSHGETFTDDECFDFRPCDGSCAGGQSRIFELPFNVAEVVECGLSNGAYAFDLIDSVFVLIIGCDVWLCDDWVEIITQSQD